MRDYKFRVQLEYMDSLTFEFTKFDEMLKFIETLEQRHVSVQRWNGEWTLEELRYTTEMMEVHDDTTRED